MNLFHRLGHVLGHPSNTYFYGHWATALAAKSIPRDAQASSLEGTDAETHDSELPS